MWYDVRIRTHHHHFLFLRFWFWFWDVSQRMDVTLIIAVVLLLLFVAGLIFAVKRGGTAGAPPAEQAQPARRLAPVDNNLPRAAQVRQRRRPVNPRNVYEEEEQRNEEEEFDPETANEIVGLDGKMGKKKQAKLQAKEEKRIQREVISTTIASWRHGRFSFSKRWSNVKNERNVTRNRRKNVERKNWKRSNWNGNEYVEIFRARRCDLIGFFSSRKKKNAERRKNVNAKSTKNIWNWRKLSPSTTKVTTKIPMRPM